MTLPHLRDFKRFVRDRNEILRTFGRRLLGPALVEDFPFTPGEVQQAVRRVHPDRVAMTITRIRALTPTTKSLTLVPRQGAFPPFEAGQYVNVFLRVHGVKTSRPYSLCSPPSRVGSIELIVKRKEGGFVSPFLHDEAREGDAVEVSGPAGEFHFNPLRDTRSWVMLAGGSGIAPFVGMIEDAVERALPVRMLLLYGSRVQTDIICRDRLDRLAGDQRELQVVHVLSEPEQGWEGESGFLDRACLARHLTQDALAQSTFFLCGPGKMLELTCAELGAMGVPSRRIRLEAYGAPDDPTRLAGWPEGVAGDQVVSIHVEGREAPVEGTAGEPIMNALERAGLVVPSLCRSGTCASCRTRLLAGDVFTPSGVSLRDTDRRAGIIHPCMTYAVGDVTLRLP